jgi:DNA modification methylase
LIELNKIYNYEASNFMKENILDEFIDLTITSPPYDNLRSYKGYSFDFENIAKELFRITKPNGVVVWVVGDATIKGSESGTSFRQALHFKEIGFNLHDTMIYKKYPVAPQYQHPRYQPEFEYMFVLCKGYPPKSFNPLTEPTRYAGKVTKPRGQRNTDNTYRHPKGKEVVTGEFKRRGNIWTYSNSRPLDLPPNSHPAIFPEKLVEDHLISWSNEGDIVFDPFLGSGTTAKMAIINNRNFIGCEISLDYYEIASERIKNIKTQ